MTKGYQIIEPPVLDELLPYPGSAWRTAMDNFVGPRLER
jgi:hypothetical protein